jgi:NADH dehydrogenase (ubiquinone) 1 alpha subcomplex subunit 9
MFGFEDRLLHKLAGMTNVFTSNHMQERYNPVHAIDVGKALEKMIQDDDTAQQTYEIVDKEIIKRRRHINVPKRIMKPIGKILNQALWWPTTSADEIEREFLDQKIDPSAKTFADLGIEPAELASLTFHYLVRDSPLMRLCVTNNLVARI